MASPSTPGFLNNLRSLTPQFLPHYTDVAPHSGFNPNAMFSLMYNERRHQGHGDDDASFTWRRGLLEFEVGVGTLFDGMLVHGKEKAMGKDGEEDEGDEEDNGEDVEGKPEEEDKEEGVEAEGGIDMTDNKKQNEGSDGNMRPQVEGS
jgi:hypothetical protein